MYKHKKDHPDSQPRKAFTNQVASKSPQGAPSKINRHIPGFSLLLPIQTKKGKKKNRQQSDDYKQPEAKRTDGSQDFIQKKMVHVCKMLSGGGQISAELAKWYKNVIVNGLCGGWATVHRYAPGAINHVWTALEYWDPSDGLKSLKIDPRVVVSVLVEAYRAMDKLEPDADYGPVPEEASEHSVKLDTKKMSNFKTKSVPVGPSGAGKTLLKVILNEPKVKKTGNHCTIHIETHNHHMSLRTRSLAKELRIVDIVESEKIGVVNNPDSLAAAHILDAGFYLYDPNGKITEMDVILKFWLET